MNAANNPLTTELQALDSAHFLHPFTDHQGLAAKGARIITRADGIHVWDSEGHQILDAMSGLWCVNAGYGRRELAEAAYRQMLELPYYNSFFQTTTEPAVRLAARLSELAPPVGGRRFSHVFFSSSGSESNDTNVRLVRRYWDLMGQPRRKVIISRHNAYHGSTMAGASLGGMSGMHAQGDLPIPNITHIDQPYYFENALPGESRDDFGRRAAGWLEARIMAIGADKVAAFIGEPVQGAGGVIIPPATYWPEIQRIVDKYGILLIADEVITGFGRTGNWFGFPTELPEIVEFPVPGLDDSPEPTFPVPDAAPGLPNVTAEKAPKSEPSPPKVGIRTWANTQWWSGPLRAGESPWSLAKWVTGDGRRYPELMPANPEKATVGKPGSAGYTFASFKIGERVRLPKGWNIYISQQGHADGKGTILPRDPDEPVSI